MNKKQFEKNLEQIHTLFQDQEKHLNALSQGISEGGKEREVLDDFLKAHNIEKNSETYYIASARIGDKKFEPLDNYLEKIWKTQSERDEVFESSYKYVSEYYQKLQEIMLESIETQELLTDFYMCIFHYTHKLWKLYSDLFLKWNRKLLFESNRELENKFENDSEAIIDFLNMHNLFDIGHHGEKADRCYSLLVQDGDSYVSRAYAEIFQEEVKEICQLYQVFIKELSQIPDTVYGREKAYLNYFWAIEQAWKEKDVNTCVSKWTAVDIAWMEIDTPIQPWHLMEYYEDKYRRSVSIEFDLRLDDWSLFDSTVQGDIEHMYESMYSEIGRENFLESYKYSLNNQKKVGLHIWAPVLQYGSFLCGAYSAQVVPNDDEVSQVHGKKIFAFPKFVLESKRAAPQMKLDTEMISSEILEKYHNFLYWPDESFYKIYDIETIGHEFGHTLWLTPWCEVRMWETGLFKNIEEFKATAGWLVAYFFSWVSEYDEDLLLDHIMRSTKIMRYREVEDIVPYYCECLIHLHILFESQIISFEKWKIVLNYSDENYKAYKNLYIATYTQQIFTYLNQMDAGNFLFEFVVQENGLYFPKDKKVRKFVEEYYARFKDIGNEVLD